MGIWANVKNVRGAMFSRITRTITITIWNMSMNVLKNQNAARSGQGKYRSSAQPILKNTKRARCLTMPFEMGD